MICYNSENNGRSEGWFDGYSIRAPLRDLHVFYPDRVDGHDWMNLCKADGAKLAMSRCFTHEVPFEITPTDRF